MIHTHSNLSPIGSYIHPGMMTEILTGIKMGRSFNSANYYLLNQSHFKGIWYRVTRASPLYEIKMLHIITVSLLELFE